MSERKEEERRYSGPFGCETDKPTARGPLRRHSGHVASEPTAFHGRGRNQGWQTSSPHKDTSVDHCTLFAWDNVVACPDSAPPLASSACLAAKPVDSCVRQQACIRRMSRIQDPGNLVSLLKSKAWGATAKSSTTAAFLRIPHVDCKVPDCKRLRLERAPPCWVSRARGIDQRKPKTDWGGVTDAGPQQDNFIVRLVLSGLKQLLHVRDSREYLLDSGPNGIRLRDTVCVSLLQVSCLTDRRIMALQTW
ncbi:uncharacterized protein IWZ02DRAFT_25262 [Phyllosticta citriasiana]|uniref:uncharacterized protein n=1 Tax=Phyllosticta citriasiana TaxID=595635 RepID=UPI0030FDF323